MKQIFLFALLLLFTSTIFSQIEKGEIIEVTTYYFIRHAEKDRSNPDENNPKLTEKGLNRAQSWSDILGQVKFDAVYSTDYERTLETGRPAAKKNNLDMVIYDPKIINAPELFLKETIGKTVLIVGHSNTTPAFVNAVIKQKKYVDIDDSNNGNLYIVTLTGSQILDQVLTIN